MTASDGAKGRTWKAIEEVWGSLASLEERTQEIRRTRGRRHGLRRERRIDCCKSQYDRVQMSEGRKGDEARTDTCLRFSYTLPLF